MAIIPLQIMIIIMIYNNTVLRAPPLIYVPSKLENKILETIQINLINNEPFQILIKHEKFTFLNKPALVG